MSGRRQSLHDGCAPRLGCNLYLGGFRLANLRNFCRSGQSRRIETRFVMHYGFVKATRASFVTIFCLGALVIVSAASIPDATAGGSSKTITTNGQSGSKSFCYPATKLVGTYSVNVELVLGLNDNGALPTLMSSRIRTAVRALADSSLTLSNKAPTAHLASELRHLSAELNESKAPIDVVRAEAAFGSTGYPELAHLCTSAMMIMTSTNPLGGFNAA